MAILSDVSQRRIITDNYSLVEDEMNKYKKDDMGYMVDYEVIEENLYLLKLTNNRVGDHYPYLKKDKEIKYYAGKEINDIRGNENIIEKKELKLTVSIKDIDCVKRLINIISEKCTEEGSINEYNMQLLIALLGERFEKDYCMVLPRKLGGDKKNE